jgi:hypothetical protein
MSASWPAASATATLSPHRACGRRPRLGRDSARRLGNGRAAGHDLPMKGQEKPKKTQKKQAQKTLKERRAEKRAAETKKPSSI